MDIDLLITEKGQAGLVATGSGFESAPAGAMFDAETHSLTLEFDEDSLELNIPVDSEFAPALLYAAAVQVGVIDKGVIQGSWQVPLMLINDPDNVRGPGRERPMRPSNSVLAFERFLQGAAAGQPVHRDDLGNELSAGSVMSGLNTAILQFAPNLARQRTMEAAPKPAPSGPSGPRGPGGMGGGGGAPPARTRGNTMPPADDEENW
jgi:hypothetical protein